MVDVLVQSCPARISPLQLQRGKALREFLAWRWPSIGARTATCGRTGNGLIWRWNVSTGNGRLKHCPNVFVSIKLEYSHIILNSARSCGLTIPTAYMGMEIAWPYKKRELGDSIIYTCPSQTTTWEEMLVDQVVKCVWHRQTDSMIWWPPEVHNCNRKTLIPGFFNVMFNSKRFKVYSTFLGGISKVRK